LPKVKFIKIPKLTDLITNLIVFKNRGVFLE
jgi:hypothetical protein